MPPCVGEHGIVHRLQRPTRRAPDRLQARVGIAGRMILLGSIAAGGALASALTGALSISDVYLAMAAGTLVVGMCSAPFVLRLDD